VPFKLDVVEKI